MKAAAAQERSVTSAREEEPGEKHHACYHCQSRGRKSEGDRDGRSADRSTPEERRAHQSWDQKLKRGRSASTRSSDSSDFKEELKGMRHTRKSSEQEEQEGSRSGRHRARQSQPYE